MADFDLVDNTRNAMQEAIKTSDDRVVKRSAELMEQFSTQEVPVDTGLLRSSHFHDKVGELNYRVYGNTFYAAFVHFGTVNQQANPWMSRAWPRVQNAIKSEL